MTDSQKHEKTNVMGQYVIASPSINIDNVTLDVVNQFTYVGPTIGGHLSLCADINVVNTTEQSLYFGF